jgi:hypothetical protein
VSTAEELWAVSAIVVGLIITSLVFITWFKGATEPTTDEEIDLKKHMKRIAFGLAFGGVLIGLGIGDLLDVPQLTYRLGFIPVWVLAAVPAGYLFGLEWKGFKNHPIRTPVIGFFTALLIFFAAGHAVVTGVAHGAHSVQTTSHLTKSKG